MSTDTTGAAEAGSNAAEQAFDAMVSHAAEASARVLGHTGGHQRATDESTSDEAETVHGAAEEAAEDKKDEGKPADDWKASLTDYDRQALQFSHLLNDPKTATQALSALVEGLHEHHGKAGLDIKAELAKMFGGGAQQAPAANQRPTLPEGKTIDTATADELDSYIERLTEWKAKQAVSELGIDQLRQSVQATEQDRQAQLQAQRLQTQAKQAYDAHAAGLQKDYPGLELTPDMFHQAMTANPQLADDPKAAIVKHFPGEIRKALTANATRHLPKAPTMGPDGAGNPKKTTRANPTDAMPIHEAAALAIRNAGGG